MQLPEIEPMPPMTTISRISYVIVEAKGSAWTVVWNMANSAPPTPAKKLEIMKENILCLKRLIPMASAATSSSRMDLKARP